MAGSLFATANMPLSCSLPTCQGATYSSPLALLYANHLPTWTSSFYLLPKSLDSRFCHLFGLPSCWALLQKIVYSLGLALSHYMYFLVLTCTKENFTFSLAATPPFYSYDPCPVMSVETIMKKTTHLARISPILLLQLKTSMASNSLIFSIASSLVKLPGPIIPDWFLGFFPFSFPLASKTCGLHADGLMPWISSSWLSHNSAVIWPSILRLYLASSACWPLPKLSY